MSEALNPVFVENFQRDPTLTWQYFGSSTGFFRIYPGEDIGWHLHHLLGLFSGNKGTGVWKVNPRTHPPGDETSTPIQRHLQHTLPPSPQVKHIFSEELSECMNKTNKHNGNQPSNTRSELLSWKNVPSTLEMIGSHVGNATHYCVTSGKSSDRVEKALCQSIKTQDRTSTTNFARILHLFSSHGEYNSLSFLYFSRLSRKS